MYCCIEHIIYSASRHIASYIITQIYHSNTSRMIVYYKKCKMYIKVYDTPTSKHVIKEKKIIWPKAAQFLRTINAVRKEVMLLIKYVKLINAYGLHYQESSIFPF